MTEPSRSAGPTIVPYFGYRDAAAALRWLAEAFGFEERQAYVEPDGAVMHAEMAFGGGVVMIGTGERPAEGDAAATSPTGHGVYVVVGDVDAHHERANSAGARVVYGPEGYEWSFGTYSPSVL
jgi:uncharacterized glyoxalase superfamily protein PhnB